MLRFSRPSTDRYQNAGKQLSLRITTLMVINTRRVVMAAFAAVLLAGSAPVLQADQIIYNNNAVVNSGIFSDVASSQFVGDKFILAPSANVITGIQWTGTYGLPLFLPQVDNFSIQIFADVGNVPALTPFISLAIGDPGHNFIGKLPGDNDPRFNLFAYSVNVAPIVLAPNTTFWLSIFDDTSADAQGNWAWAAQFMAGNSVSRPSQAGPWFLAGFRQDFELTGPAAVPGPATVPEPSTLALFVLGILTLLGYHWYCKHRASVSVLLAGVRKDRVSGLPKRVRS
jgi:hypothetical protein